MTSLPLSKVRANLSTLVRRAERGDRVGITVRGKVVAWLVPTQDVEAERRKPRPMRGSLKLVKPLEDARAGFLEWLGVQR